MDEGDAAGASASAGLRGRIGRAVKAHRAGVRPHDAADDVHQRALAGAILPDQAEDAATAEREVDVADRVDAGERLGDAVRARGSPSLMTCPRSRAGGCGRRRARRRRG